MPINQIPHVRLAKLRLFSKFSSFLALSALALSFLALSGCSSPKDASKENYRAAIERYFEQRDDFPHCIFRYNFPIQGNDIQLKMQGLTGSLNTLTELGLLNKESKKTKDRWKRESHHYSYTLSDEGKKYYLEERGICIGKAKLLDLHNISEPYEEKGKKRVEGEYSWTIELPDWAMDKRFYESKAFSGELFYFRYKKLLKGEAREDFFTLTLKDEGWDF